MKRGAVLFVLLLILAAETRLWQNDAGSLPPAAPRPTLAPGGPDIVLTYGADRVISINGRPVALANLQATLEEMYRNRQERTLWLDGDGSVPYGEIAGVMNIARKAGIERVGVITPGMRAEQSRGRAGGKQ